MPDLISVFSYAFMQRALLVGLLVAPCAALLGVTLVLKRFSMIGDGLSHVGFGALSFALAFSFSPLYIALPAVILAAFFLLRLSDNSRMDGDAAIALVSSSAVAFGVIITSLSRGMSTDVYDLMFGSILSMTQGDLILSVLLSLAVLILFFVFYHKIFAITFDEAFACTSGIRVKSFNMMIALLTAVTIVVGMRIMGSMLISSLIIFPALTAMRIFKSFRAVTVCAVIVSISAFLAGLILSFAFSLPAGATIVLVNLIIFAVFTLIGHIK